MTFGTPVMPNKKLTNIFFKTNQCEREQKEFLEIFILTHLFTEKVTNVTTSQYL